MCTSRQRKGVKSWTADEHFEARNPPMCTALGTGAMPRVLGDELDNMVASNAATTQQDLSILATKARSLTYRLDAPSRSDLLHLLLQRHWSTKLGILQPFLIATVVLETSEKEVADSPALTQCLDSVASLQAAMTSSTATSLALNIENSKLVLEHIPGLVNQHIIDTLLSDVCQVLSSKQIFDDEHEYAMRPTAIFDRICALLGSILSRFRRRLADRHHLLLPVLQGLLKCFFFPGTTASRSRQTTASAFSVAFVEDLPSWLKASEQPLPSSSAAKLSRLLSTICNPTVSAARSSRKHTQNELNDEVKHVKALAGQHMQYLVMEYARCSLDGEIRSEVKEKLMPGMYTVLDAMSRDVMRGMNAAMDPSSRAIFKTLYDDWTRYGKWDRS